jgi:hypothetical protein
MAETHIHLHIHHGGEKRRTGTTKHHHHYKMGGVRRVGRPRVYRHHRKRY